MKRLGIALFAILMATSTVAQEVKTQASHSVFRNRIFTIQNRDVRTLASAVKLLGSGFEGADLSINEELRTITVRDLPENLATIEEALKRLDQPAAQTPDVELRFFVLIGSKSAPTAATIPDDLAPVVKQLQSTLAYSHYGLMTSGVHRTKPGIGLEGSGVVESTLLGLDTVRDRPITYSYTMRGIALAGSNETRTVEIGNVEFSMRLPLTVGANDVQYQSVGFKTPVSLGQREKVVIGTTTMRDKALIVILMAEVK
jgi:hypothetical protein